MYSESQINKFEEIFFKDGENCFRLNGIDASQNFPIFKAMKFNRRLSRASSLQFLLNTKTISLTRIYFPNNFLL